MLTTQRLYALTLAGYLGLFLLLMAWHSFIAPPERFPRSLVLILLVGPMMFPLRGLLHGRPYTFAWSSFLALLYVILGTTEAVANPEARPLAAAEATLAMLWFSGAVLFARFRGRELRGQ